MTDVDKLKTRAEIDEETRKELSDAGHETVREINNRIQGVLDSAPSDASVSLTIRQSKDGYKGVLKILSKQRKFIGGGADKRFSVVLDRIFEEVRQQIDDWKKRRFAGSSNGTP